MCPQLVQTVAEGEGCHGLSLRVKVIINKQKNRHSFDKVVEIIVILHETPMETPMP